MATNQEPTSLVTEPDLQAALTTISRFRTQALQVLDFQNQLASASQANGALSSTSTKVENIKKDIAILQTKLWATNARMRAQQRRAVMSTRGTKAATSEARQEVDGLSLMLQNLVYEQRHLMGEIEACEDYKFVIRYCEESANGLQSFLSSITAD
jgi:THO complex subunit 5